MSEHVNKKSEQFENNSAHFVSEARRRMGLTQLQFAEMLGISRNYVYMLENGVKPLTSKMRERIKKGEHDCSLSVSSVSSPGAAPSPADPCHYPGDIPARLDAIERSMEHMVAQLETVTALLSGALRSSLEKPIQRKAG